MPWTKVYGFSTPEEAGQEKSGAPLREITYREAINEALSQMLDKDERVFVLGEGVDDPGGVFGTTKGLQERFGSERVFDIPLAENGMTGVAMGAALAGLRPVLVHMRVDFIPLTLDQLINHASKWHYMFGGKVHVPLVVRAIIGRGWGSAAQHSQSLHALFAHVPGLKVVMPSTPYDAKGMLMAAVYDGNPVMFLEHRWLYEGTGNVPEAPYRVPIGKTAIRRKGRDVTVVAFSHMAKMAMEAAGLLSGRGTECEVVDLRTLNPMDDAPVIESVKKTGRLVIADTGWKSLGIGAEVAARVVEKAFGELKAPIERVNPPGVPTPSSPVLEEAYYQDVEDIVTAVERVLAYGK
jgi:pyruvate dehydrogenase E1 component beta subunit